MERPRVRPRRPAHASPRALGPEGHLRRASAAGKGRERGRGAAASAGPRHGAAALPGGAVPKAHRAAAFRHLESTAASRSWRSRSYHVSSMGGSAPTTQLSSRSARAGLRASAGPCM